MTKDTKRLLKSATSNSVSVLGYLSTAATFLPIGDVMRPYVRSLGLVLIIIGVFRGAQAVIADKNKEMEASADEIGKQADDIRMQKDVELAKLQSRIVELSRRPYAEELASNVRELLSNLSDEGRGMLLHLLKHAPIENGRPIGNVQMDRQYPQLEIMSRSGIVRCDQEKTGLMRAYWVINERYRVALEDLLYEKS